MEVDDLLLYVLHDLGDLDLDPSAAGFRMVISGHSHDPKIAERQGVVYLNPGSAGPRRAATADLAGRIRLGEADGQADRRGAYRSMQSFAFGSSASRIEGELISLEESG